MPEQRTFDPYHDVLVNLPVETQRLLLKILSRHDPMAVGTSAKVKDVCQRYETELMTMFGLVPAYYAYALIYWASNQSVDAIKMAYEELPPDGEPPPRARDLFSRN